MRIFFYKYYNQEHRFESKYKGTILRITYYCSFDQQFWYLAKAVIQLNVNLS